MYMAKIKSIALLLCLGAARAADLDGDGVADAAAADTCCALKYGNALSECSSATDLAGTASCCPAGGASRLKLWAGSRACGQGPVQREERAARSARWRR